MTKILVFGDSVAWGAFDEEGGWVDRLKKNYIKEYKDKKVQIYNLGASGADSNGILKYLKLDIERLVKLVEIEKEKLIILFSIGKNDPYYINTKDKVNISPLEFENNIENIIKIAKQYSNRIIFTGLIGVNNDLTQPRSRDEFWDNKDMVKYNNIIQNICEKNNVHFIPLINFLNLKQDLKDGLHPNTKGHKKIYERVKEFLENKII